jgi:hypothetical protein
MAFWSGWLSLIEEDEAKGDFRVGLLSGRPALFVLRLDPRQDLQRIRHNPGIAICRVAVRLKALVALR